MSRASSLPLLSLLSALFCGLGGFFLGVLIAFGSTHGDSTKLVSTVMFFGALATAPPLLLGVTTVRSAISRGKWMGWVAIVSGVLVGAFYLLLLTAALRKQG